MKNFLNILIIFFTLGLFYACNEEPVGQQPMDKVAPGPVTNVQIRNIAGGAVFRYSLPNDDDLLYVKAVYYLKGDVKTETKASVYADSLVIHGFGDTNDHEVELIAVDRSRNESAAETVTITPLTPEVLSIGSTLQIVEDYGGINAIWDNPNKAEISVNILYKDHNDEYVPLEAFYSSVANGVGKVREMDTIPYDFSVYVEDKWNNQSERQHYTLTPWYETEFDKNKFQAVVLPTDADPVIPDYGIFRLWDGVTGADPCYSSTGGRGDFPHHITMDMGVVAKISRIRLFQRTQVTQHIFGEGNPRKFQIWGCVTLDPSGSWDNWTLLMDCESIKPSGLPQGQNSDEDLNIAYNGEDFVNDPANPKVRYLRIKVTQTWTGGDNFQIGEINIYGDNRQK